MGARRGLVTPGSLLRYPGDIIPEWWRHHLGTGGRLQIGMVGEIISESWATSIGIRSKPEWPLVDMKKRLVVIQDRKDPRNKDGNDQKVPLLNLTGYDAWEVVLQQRIVTRGYGRIFPHNHRSVSAAFTRACDELKIEDLHFHDLRHEGTSRLFEAGLPIEKVALVTGHKDWRQLQRYTNLKVEDLLKLQYAQQPSMEEFVETLAAS